MLSTGKAGEGYCFFLFFTIRYSHLVDEKHVNFEHKFSTLHDFCGLSMKREYPEGPVVAVAAVIFYEGSVLLARRNQEPGMGQWSLPGGAVELGEGLLEALKRELWEEAAINVEIGGLIGVFDRIVGDSENRVRYHYVIVDYWGWIASGEPSPGSDISDLRFVPLEEFDTFEVSTELKETVWKAVGMRNKGI
jgi:ADP-ribose pyrophosphatase YjhB (NUDIX family)